MTIQEIEELLDDTRRLPRAADKVALHMAIGTLEIARQLALLNERLAAGETQSSAKPPAGKRK